MNFLNDPWIVGIGVTVIAGLILYYVFGIGKPIKDDNQKGGRGGDAKVHGLNNAAIGGKGGGGGPGGNGGDGGGAEVVGDNSFAMGGEGGEAGQIDRGGKGGRGPLHALMEDYPGKYKEISEKFGITEEMAKTIGKGGDGAGPSVAELQKRQFEKNEANFKSGRNSNK
jgi:hypothetical protein